MQVPTPRTRLTRRHHYPISIKAKPNYDQSNQRIQTVENTLRPTMISSVTSCDATVIINYNYSQYKLNYEMQINTNLPDIDPSDFYE